MISLAWRNNWRHRRRGILTAGAVAMVVALTLLLFGLSDAMRNGMFENLTDAGGHLAIRVEGWRQIRRLDELLIRDAAAVAAGIDQLQAMSEEIQVASILEVPALLAGEERSRGVQLVGLDQPAELRRDFAADYLGEGRLPDTDSLEGVVLGQALARALRVAVGDVVYAFAPGTEGYGAAAYTVVGLLDLPDSVMEGRTGYLSLPAVQELAAPGSVTRFEIHLPQLRRLADESAVGELQRRLTAQLAPGFSVETWRQVNPDLATILDLLEPILLFYAAIFFGIAGLLVVNTVYLGQVERIHEFGIIIALGADRWQVMRLVFLETAALVLSGAAAGGLIGLLAIARLRLGFSLPGGLAEIYAEFGLPTVLYAGLSPLQLILTVVFVLIMAFLAALWPAWVAGRLEPVEAMRFVT